ncbi:PEP-CTERM-box response regulator transcription factor [Marinobacterium mangrovicola]|uniref:Two-component system NtrC family response regulator n=1 Tax=Marinobacterium mangrovicola TaxID=1476959 RepID=A0A4V2PE31_9GAMM|nr:PEP-CTERM-box response regulator transcription factor [Marinobacterium mangrovicola]TCK07526.1 two-component system NtrC family response regulator [Marinobacterium mangrovicola]
MTNKFKPMLLVVEDDPILRKQLKWHFSDYQFLEASTCDEAIAIVKKYRPAVILQDLGIPPEPEGVEAGMKCISEILSVHPNGKLIVMTGRGDHANAIRAISLGAQDFFQKPVSPQTLDFIVERGFRISNLQSGIQHGDIDANDLVSELHTKNEAMIKVCKTIKKLAPTDITCTLLGESGVGKEVLANAIHRNSDRRDRKFMAINCASIPENLIESELYGYEKGAFTGAIKRSEGKIESASGGTLFLDEIGDMPLSIQASLLRFLQERKIQKLGSTKDIPVDVRVVCATNKNLLEMVANGDFREDLYYRICEYVIKIPSLNDRREDKLSLANSFLNEAKKKYNPAITGFTPKAQKEIIEFDWPGNIRELESRVNIAAVMAENSLVTAEDMGFPVEEDEGSLAEKEDNAVDDSTLNVMLDTTLNLKDVRRQAEVVTIKQALDRTKSISEAAKVLGVSRPTLYDLMKKYSLVS